MATKLDKELVRESTIIVKEREVVVTLSAEQEIKLKLKGMKTGELKIGIRELYSHLSGETDEPEEVVEEKNKPLSIVKSEKVDKDNPVINLYDLRSWNAISTLDLPTLTKFDGLIADLIKHKKDLKK